MDTLSARLSVAALLLATGQYERADGYAREVRGDLRQYVAFVVGPERYALPIHQISEISKPRLMFHNLYHASRLGSSPGLS